MEKVNISTKDFNDLLNKTYNTYMNFDGGIRDSIEEALRNHIFNVKNEFKENEWNSCDVEPPEKYYNYDVIIRKKDSVCPDDNTGHTSNCCAYYVGFYDPETGTFIDEDEDEILYGEYLSEYEYKFIK